MLHKLMIFQRQIFRALLFLMVAVFSNQKALAIEEPYLNEIRGANVAVGNSFTVTDEKFANNAAWGLIQQHISVNNIISFELNFDTTINFYSKPFDCTVQFKVYIYGNQADTSEITDSVTHSNISLQVRYDTVTGKPYKAIALYKFTNAHKFKVKILNITCPQLDPIPAVFRLKGQIIVDRKYTFQDNSTDVTRYAVVNNNQLQLYWTPSAYPGAESFDLEYTHIDARSEIAASILSYQTGADYFVPVDSLDKWFKNNSTRINTPASSHLVNLIYDSGFVLFRIRGTQIHYPDNIRWEGNWNYAARALSAGVCSTCPAGVVYLDGHETKLNWQFTATFAEEGKRHEIVTYFDGTLRDRQSVKISNADNVSIVKESIYDALGRPTVNILPAPAEDSTMHYFRGFNKNKYGLPYSYKDLVYGSSCTTTADSVSSASGAGKYFSSNNPFISKYYYAKYIPSAEGYPYSVTEYMADNTGRVRSQGGLGAKLQLHNGHATRLFYGKPTQEELDRLFGTEVGNASHYLKNMIVDPNGQILVSYSNSSGQKIATAMAGAVPGNLHALPSQTTASTIITDDLIKPEDFSRNASDYSISANATFLAPVTGAYIFNYKVDPLRMEKWFGAKKDSVICNNCYYDLVITVKDDCNNILQQETRAVGNVFDTTCATPPGSITGTFTTDIAAIGEYYVNYRLVISKDALDFYDSVHLVKNTDIKKINYFLLDELKHTDFYGCVNNCETCFDALGTKEEFVLRFRQFYIADSIAFNMEDSLWVRSLYDSLYANCQAIQSQCGQNVCDEKLEMLMMDVTPGGQYAQYDTATYALLEPTINVLAKRNTVSFVVPETGEPMKVTVYPEGGDPVEKNVADLTDAEFIEYWRDEWARPLATLHPEYCHYLWCIANSNSYDFDKKVGNLIDAEDAASSGWFNTNNYDAILAQDPFFQPSGLGYPMVEKMRDSLRLFSRTFARQSLSDRNILRFIDVILYCKDQAEGWENCIPDEDCRSRNREWFLYSQLYLNLKLQFYEAARRTSSDPVFANCVNCFIGKDLAGPPPCVAPPVSDFTVSQYSAQDSVVVKYMAGADTVKGTYTVIFKTNCGTFTPVVFNIGDSLKYFIVPDPGCLIEIDTVVCGDQLKEYPENTCNFTCAPGVISPYGKPNLSYYIEKGHRWLGPMSKPSHYGNCRYYSMFDVKTGPDITCRFFNVWVCEYDTTCGGPCIPNIYPSQCPEDPNAAFYATKVKRYPEYVNADEFINSTLGGNPQQLSGEYAEAAIDECKSNCEANAALWINTLGRCTTDEVKLAQLKQALIDICSGACSVERVHGASSIPENQPATYHSFEEAIVGILGAGALNDSCTAELLANPYPYDKQPALTERSIMETDYAICAKVAQYKTEWQQSGYTGSFHRYLSKNYGGAYQLDSLELDDLMNACSNCNGLLKDDIVLPLILEPGAPPCLVCDSLNLAVEDFNTKFPDVDTNTVQFEQLMANFLNHRFGYSLMYYQYNEFLKKCTLNSLTAGKLCNQPQSPAGEIPQNGNSCMAGLYATALTNAAVRHSAYIDSVRKDFREAYMTRCLNVLPLLSMKAELFEYHYTLYYYDQSGSLVKTIPPAGVVLLDSTQLELVKLHRLLQKEGCYQYSDSILLNNNGQIAWNYIEHQYEQDVYSIEMMGNLTTHNDQIILSKFSELQVDTSEAAPEFYLNSGLLVKIVGNKFEIGLYGFDDSLRQRQAIATSIFDASIIAPLNKWNHFVVQRTMDSMAPVKLWVNGNQVGLSFTGNRIDSASWFVGEGPLTVGNYEATQMPATGRLTGSVKNLRIYNRLITASEIRQNAFNVCQTPSKQNGLIFWAAMNEAPGNIVKDRVGMVDGELTGVTWMPFAGVFPEHRLPTTYAYNSFGNLDRKYSIDGDTTSYWYDRIGRVIASQNKEQKENSSYDATADRYSYTLYDVLGRIIESGEKSSPSSDIREIDLFDTAATNNWLASGIDKQVMKTVYDRPVNNLLQGPSNLRTRVSASIHLAEKADIEGDSTIYNYDIQGNVNTILQHIKLLARDDLQNGKKRLGYEYDLISGKPNKIIYQQGRGDQFIHKYEYNAENKLTKTLTSRDNLVWNEESSYLYYLHGPLARLELGNYKVQGVDYAYTIQGYLKGINGDVINENTEMGHDGKSGGIFSSVSRDVYGYKIGFFDNDFLPVGLSGAQAFNQFVYTAPPLSTGILPAEASGNQLFNGNISHISVSNKGLENGALAGYTYGYDQLNRLVEMRQHNTSAAWGNVDATDKFKESISYDPNGNILKYLRNGEGVSGKPLEMDSLNYKYDRDEQGYLVNNRLRYITDNVSSSNHSKDIDNQNSENYIFDRLGNLIKDEAEGIDTICWNVLGKIAKITKTDNTLIEYGYDAFGERITKKVTKSDEPVAITYYLKDVDGNVIAIYEKNGTDQVRLKDQFLYGHKRIGTWTYDSVALEKPAIVENDIPVMDSILIGKRQYELTNHLGNVLVIISDKKKGIEDLVSNTVISHFEAEVLTGTDYYPFGMLMREGGSKNYRYGFNGKENDNEVKGGDGLQQDYGLRIYDTRIGRFLSVDPIAESFPWNSPFAFAENDVIRSIDLDGLEKFILITDQAYNPKTKQTQLQRHIYLNPDEQAHKLGLILHHDAENNKTIVDDLDRLSDFDKSVVSYGFSVMKERAVTGGSMKISGNEDIKLKVIKAADSGKDGKKDSDKKENKKKDYVGPTTFEGFDGANNYFQFQTVTPASGDLGDDLKKGLKEIVKKHLINTNAKSITIVVNGYAITNSSASTSYEAAKVAAERALVNVVKFAQSLLHGSDIKVINGGSTMQIVYPDQIGKNEKGDTIGGPSTKNAGVKITVQP